MLPSKNLSKEEKKELMLRKYVKRDPMDIEEIKKFGVFWRPANGDVMAWKLICITETLEEARHEIEWRYNFVKFNDGDIVLDNDKRFSTFRNELENKDSKGETIEPTDEDMVNTDLIPDNASLIEALPISTTKFKSFSYYSQIPLEYKGLYKIEELFDIS